MYIIFHEIECCSFVCLFAPCQMILLRHPAPAENRDAPPVTGCGESAEGNIYCSLCAFVQGKGQPTCMWEEKRYEPVASG